jgi:hypothetical protein
MVMNDHAAAIAKAMAELEELYGDRIKAEVATWPPLTLEQRAELALLLISDQAATGR